MKVKLYEGTIIDSDYTIKGFLTLTNDVRSNRVGDYIPAIVVNALTMPHGYYGTYFVNIDSVKECEEIEIKTI